MVWRHINNFLVVVLPVTPNSPSPPPLLPLLHEQRAFAALLAHPPAIEQRKKTNGPHPTSRGSHRSGQLIRKIRASSGIFTAPYD